MLIRVAFRHWSENRLGHAQEPGGLCCSRQAAVSTLAPVVYIDGAKTHAPCGLFIKNIFVNITTSVDRGSQWDCK